MKRFLLAVLLSSAALAQDLPVQITVKPQGLLHGTVSVPVTGRADVRRLELFVNGMKHAGHDGGSTVFQVPIGEYVRRLRFRVVGYDASGAFVGDDEMVVNDPQPPFRIRLHTPPSLPSNGFADITATITKPPQLQIAAVDFFVGEKQIATDAEPPYAVNFDVAQAEDAAYARAVARARTGQEANDIRFWNSAPVEHVEVNLQQVPLSISGPVNARLAPSAIRLFDNAEQKPIEGIVPANDLPLNIILLLDSSESMLEELPTLQRAAKEFARSLIRPNDRIAVVGFHERLFWLTGFTSDMAAIDRAIDGLRPLGRTHLYDATIQMMYELQKRPGRRALVVLTDGVNQGGSFKLDHLIHYARYSGVPVYPIIKNTLLSRLMRFGIGRVEARRFADVARESGATWFIIERADQLPKVYQQIAEELKQQYLLMFYAEGSGTDLWHSLKIEPVDRRVRIRAPRGYFP